MRVFRNLTLGLRGLFRKSAVNREMEEELRHYADSATDENLKRGLGGAQALRSARVEIGSFDAVKERTLGVGWENFLESIWQDLCYSARMLRKSPGFTCVAVLTLALGIGANAAIFSMASWLIFRPLPVEHPEQLTFFAFATPAANSFDQFSYTEFQQLQQASKAAFSEVAVVQDGGSSGGTESADGLTLDHRTTSVETNFVSGNFFSMLGLKPYLGRLLLPGEGAAIGADPVVVLSYQYWKTRLGGDPAIVGKQALLNGHPVTIVGIAPKGFYGTAPIIETQAYLPLGMDAVEGESATAMWRDAKSPGANVIGRLKPGVSREAAAASLAALGSQFNKVSPRPGANGKLRVEELRPPGIITGENPLPRLAILFLSLAGLVLLLAALNVANLLLVRATARRQEMAVRSALGAARSRLLRQILTESFLLAVLSAAGGVFVGYLTTLALRSIPTHTALPLVLDFRLDGRAVAYTLFVSLLAGIGIGIASAFRASGDNLSQALHESSRSFSGSRQRLRSALVALQIGGSLVLLITAGLFVRSLVSFRNVDLGFDPQHVLNLTVSPYQLGYSESQGKNFYGNLLERVKALPGVKAADLVMNMPLGDSVMNADIAVSGYEVGKNQLPPSADWNTVSPGFFETLGLKIVRGRSISDADNATSPRVAVINQAMAEQFWPRQDALGKYFSLPDWKPKRTVEVIGVVRNARTNSLTSSFRPGFFLPLAQDYRPVMTLQVRSEGAPSTLTPAIRKTVAEIAPAMSISDVHTMIEGMQGMNGLFFPKAGATLAAALGAVGLILALVGIYGMISYSVSQRTQEIGIRMALGAQTAQVLRMICRQSFLIVAVSVPIGLLFAFALAKLLNDFLFGIKPTDPITYITVTLALIAVSLLAGYLPARRAAKVNPMTALRHE